MNKFVLDKKNRTFTISVNGNVIESWECSLMSNAEAVEVARIKITSYMNLAPTLVIKLEEYKWEI